MDLATIVSNLFNKLFFGVDEIFLRICDFENILSHIDDEQIHLSIVSEKTKPGTVQMWMNHPNHNGIDFNIAFGSHIIFGVYLLKILLFGETKIV